MIPYLDDIEADAKQRLQAMLNRVQQEGLEGETAIVQGLPFQTIVDMAGNKDVDMIVMGTHGRTGLTHALMGSVAERVVRLAPCPVLVTRGKIEASNA
jgi:nucleotide-binding universal stress UspA family protein